MVTTIMRFLATALANVWVKNAIRFGLTAISVRLTGKKPIDTECSGNDHSHVAEKDTTDGKAPSESKSYKV